MRLNAIRYSIINVNFFNMVRVEEFGIKTYLLSSNKMFEMSYDTVNLNNTDDNEK